MNVKEAREIWEMHLRPTPNCNCANGTGEACEKAKGFLEATKAAEPLLKMIKVNQKYFTQICEMVLDGKRHAESYAEVYSNVLALRNKALLCSAEVMENYRKEALGE